jgi:exportin-2 (importin alpha re-exporter)
LFEDNPTEWIQKDMEGNDTDTRRRCAIDLVRGMSKHFENETTALCGNHIMLLLQQYAADPANNWKAKDAALCLLVHILKSERERERLSLACL